MQLDPDPVHLESASVAIGGARLLTDVDLQVHPGEAVALLGANGSGKSTLIRAALGQVPVVSGDAQLFGMSTRHAAARVPWPRIGYVPQRLSAASGVPATALEVVLTGALGRARWWPRRSDRARALAALEQLGVSELAHRPFGVLSGGQAQRVVIARALIRDPDLLILDEPLAGVDLLTQSSFASLLSDLHTQGRTIVMVLHELGPFAELLDRAVVLRAGRVIHDGDLPRDHAHPHGAHDHLHVEHAMPTEPETQRSLP
ncbi:metal ABC transporter ATP-binding protein [Pseudactinotalea sp.]|uniref:metal ABC transporter ATP-binding protein n=1 Tax=Pseudactinotalea sp. TaxID=1926260 RepID=UPI003B3B3A3B